MEGTRFICIPFTPFFHLPSKQAVSICQICAIDEFSLFDHSSVLLAGGEHAVSCIDTNHCRIHRLINHLTAVHGLNTYWPRTALSNRNSAVATIHCSSPSALRTGIAAAI